MTGIPVHRRRERPQAAAVSTCKKHRALWEDIEDVLVSGRGGMRNAFPLEKVKATLIASGKLHG